MAGHIKRVFPGANTPQGFYSFYDYIVPPDATRVIVIKGGPGVGKSTFIRKTGEAMVERGFDIEFHHCSSDNNSLDGVAIPSIGIAVIDGTAPHVFDPKNPGAVDEIIHLGDYWDEARLRKFRTQIIACNREIKKCFERAYRYLRAAKAIYDDLEVAHMDCMDFAKANSIAEEILWDLFSSERVSSHLGYERLLFASATTPDGLVNYLNTIVDRCGKVYIIKGRPGTGKSVLLAKLARAALERGYNVETYRCPLNPEKPEHIVIEEAGIALTKSIEPHTYQPGPNDIIVDMDSCLDFGALDSVAEVFATDNRLFGDLFYTAIEFIRKAKAVHDQMEQYYIPCMDFEGITKLREKTLARILRFAEERRSAACS
ncbi:MAG: PRK06851 family protein [Bacillota bacterium]